MQHETRPGITRHQWLTLTGTTLGWGMEGFDASLYTLIVVPATKEILGPGASASSISFHAGLGVAIFLVGWALGGLLFGLLSDYFGRVRVLMVAVVLYAVFTAASAFAQEYWQLVLLRFIAGLGSGVEAPVGAVLMAETWNNRYRARAIGVMMSGFAGGFFLSSLVYGLLGEHGWRITLLVAVVPAFLALFIRRYIHEPETTADVKRRRAERRARGTRTEEDRFVLRRLFTPPLLRRMIPCLLIQTGALFAFWSTTTWTPQIITKLSGPGPGTVAHVSTATALLNLGGVVGYASWGFIADAIGRRGAFLVSFAVALIGIGVLFPFQHSLTVYLWLLPVVGFGIFGAVGGPCVQFPELFPAGVRASAIATSNSVGRLFTAAGPLIAGSLATQFFGGDLGIAVAVIASLAVLGIIGVLLAPETRNLPLAEPATEPAAVPATQ
ncbi:MAG: transporter [Amycolatopsis sp.]|jgi:MFS family permease|uniref:MFS transporter n=1 Tax=Amycolatopsis sp. TaxID=37632 RepID=UPI0026379E7A|nr:MFS transporter [Amycolatopsis sp.]MCU1687401.1 transporter [Amycolatopsis sp.]